MVRKLLHCESIVKCLCVGHKKCSKSRHKPKYFNGELLCSVLGARVDINLKRDKEYRVCWDLSKQVEEYCNQKELASTTTTAALPPLKRVRISVGDDPIVERNVEEVAPPCKKARRRTKAEVVLGSIRSKVSKYRQQYRALTNRERERRVYSLADDVLTACIPKSKVNKDICNYIENDNDLLIDLLTVIDNIKLRLERLTKRSFKIVNDGMTPPPQDNNNSQSSSITNFAKYYSTTLSRREYNQLREQYTKSQEMKLHDFPSYHTINKDSNRPDIVPIDLSVECDLPEVDFEAVGLDVDLNDTSYCAEMTQMLKPKITVKSFVGKKDIEMKDAIDDIKNSRGGVAKDKIMTARIDGSFMKYIEMMVTTSRKKILRSTATN